MQNICSGQAQQCSVRQMRSAHLSSSGTTVARATTATDMDTSRRRARVKSDVRSARRVTAGMNARTRTVRSARRAAMLTRCSTGRANCTHSTTDTSDSRSPERGRSSAALLWTSTRTVISMWARRRHRVPAVGHRSRALRARRTHPAAPHARRIQGATREHWEAKDGALEFVL
jgi:hypothetical protein